MANEKDANYAEVLRAWDKFIEASDYLFREDEISEEGMYFLNQLKVMFDETGSSDESSHESDKKSNNDSDQNIE